jgi:hypothetical protein
MCLEIVATISPNAPARISAERMSEISGLVVSSRKFEGAACLHFSVTGGCSCDFLSDGAGFESESWALSPSHLPPLSNAITALQRECKTFSFIAHWLGGERERRSRQLSGKELATWLAGTRLETMCCMSSANKRFEFARTARPTRKNASLLLAAQPRRSA